MSRRRPFDEVAYLIAAFLGIPTLVGLVFLLLGYTRLVLEQWGTVAGVAFLLLGVAVLSAATYKTVELLRASGGS